MHITGHVACKATDAVRIHDRADLNATIFNTGSVYELNDDALHIRGSAADRIAFLHRLATAAIETAEQIAAEEAVSA